MSSEVETSLNISERVRDSSTPLGMTENAGALRVEIFVVILTRSLPLARPEGLPIYVARLPPTPFTLRGELERLIASDFGILEDS
jgi:hypothetical protein